jgi:hypothetical protein
MFDAWRNTEVLSVSGYYLGEKSSTLDTAIDGGLLREFSSGLRWVWRMRKTIRTIG